MLADSTIVLLSFTRTSDLVTQLLSYIRIKDSVAILKMVGGAPSSSSSIRPRSGSASPSVVRMAGYRAEEHARRRRRRHPRVLLATTPSPACRALLAALPQPTCQRAPLLCLGREMTEGARETGAERGNRPVWMGLRPDKILGTQMSVLRV